MKKYKAEWIAFTKDRELVVFDSEKEARKEMNDNRKLYTRLFAGARWMVDEVESLDDRKDELKESIERFLDNL